MQTIIQGTPWSLDETFLATITMFTDLQLTSVDREQSQQIESTNREFRWIDFTQVFNETLPGVFRELTVTVSGRYPVTLMGPLDSYLAQTLVKNAAVEFLETGELFDDTDTSQGFNFPEWCMEHRELFAEYPNMNVAVDLANAKVLFAERDEERFVERLRNEVGESSSNFRTVHVSPDGTVRLS